MTHFLLWGNAYAKIIRNGKGEVIALYPLMPNRMRVDRNSKGALYYSYTRYSDEAPTMNAMTVTLRHSNEIAKAPIITEGQPITENQSKASAVTIADGIISVTVDVDELVKFDSSNPAQGIHKWGGILITTGLSNITKIKYNGYQIAQKDVTETAGVGGTAGDIIMWLKCDEI